MKLLKDNIGIIGLTLIMAIYIFLMVSYFIWR